MKLTLVFTQVYPFGLKVSIFLWKSLLASFFSIAESDRRCCVAHLYRHHHCSHHCHPNSHHYMYHYMHYTCQPRRHGHRVVNETASRTLFWSWFCLINITFHRHRRPINSNHNTFAVFPLPYLRKVLSEGCFFCDFLDEYCEEKSETFTEF